MLESLPEWSKESLEQGMRALTEEGPTLLFVGHRARLTVDVD